MNLVEMSDLLGIRFIGENLGASFLRLKVRIKMDMNILKKLFKTAQLPLLEKKI